VDFQLRQLLPTGYYRFQPALNGHNHSLDNTSRANMAALKALANKMIDERSADLESLSEQLTFPPRSTPTVPTPQPQVPLAARSAPTSPSRTA
jgi:hypothetical protein